MMKRFVFAFGRSLRSGLVALGALAFLGTAIAIGANYALTQGVGTTFASVVISGVNYAGYMLCDFTVGETHCASVDTNNQLEVSQATAANLNATVTGTVTANAGTNLNTSALALETGGNLAAIAAEWFAQGSTTSGQKGTLIQGAVTSSAPTYTNAQTSPLSLDTAGNLRVNVVAGGGSGGTSSSFGSAFPGTGTAVGAEYLTSAPTLTNGQMVALQTTVNGSLHTTVDNANANGQAAMASSSPVVIASDQAGTCTNHAFKHITTATDTVAVQGVTAQTVRLCAWVARAAGTATWFWENTASTNNNCSSSNTQISGLNSEVANSGVSVSLPLGITLNNTSGNGLCINSTGTGGVDIDYWYAQR